MNRSLNMTSQLIDILAEDGSRHFGSLPEVYPWDYLRDVVKRLKGAVETNYVSDDAIEFWLDFTFSGYKFSINNQFGEFLFFVRDPRCPEPILLEVLEHFGKMYA